MPDAPVSLLITLDGELAARVLANRSRADLAAAGIGTGRYGFSVRLDARSKPLQRRVLRIRREGDGAELPGSPVTFDPPSPLDPPTEP